MQSRVGFLILPCRAGMGWLAMRKTSGWTSGVVTRSGGRPAKKQSESCLLSPWPKSGRVFRAFVLKSIVAPVDSLQSPALLFFFVSPCLLAFHGLWSLLSLPLSPPHCWPTQIGWTCFSLRFTLCTLTNLLPETLAASPQLLAPPISMVTEGRVLLGICLRELAWTSCFPGIACPFAVNWAAWGEALPPAGWQAASRCRHLASLSWMSPGKYDVINRASAAGTIQHLTLIFHVSYLLSLFKTIHGDRKSKHYNGVQEGHNAGSAFPWEILKLISWRSLCHPFRLLN